MRRAATGGNGERLVVYPSRWKLTLSALGSLAFVLAGLWIGGLFGDVGASTEVIIVASYVGVPFFGLCFVYLLFRLVVMRPALVVSKEGILDNASAIGAGMIPWDEIEDIRAFAYRGQPMVGVVPRDEEALLARQNPLKRLIMRANTRVLGTRSLVNIPQTALPMTAEELAREIEHYRERGRSTTARAGGRPRKPPRSLLRIVRSVVRWIALAVLSIVYYATSSMLVLFGGLLAWNELGPGFERDPAQAHPVVGAILVLLGIAVFVFFPRLVKKPTGREVISGPYGGFGGGGDA